MFDRKWQDTIALAHAKARQVLLDARQPEGYWTGCLASSALSTATAISALRLAMPYLEVNRRQHAEKLIAAGVRWLVRQQNPDGGWGDTDRSFSNIATTVLVVAALHLAGRQEEFSRYVERAQAYIEQQGWVAGIRRRYGLDQTFAVPILTNTALAGLVSWKQVPALPFELACLPQWCYRFLGLPVVSYAIPALVAIGLVKHVHHPTWFLPYRWLRDVCTEAALRVLKRMQPESGGFLEATPLTSFVAMSVISAGRASHPVVERAIQFLFDSARPDGSWPIDSDLATWITSLAISALVADGSDLGRWLDQRSLRWLVGCQHTSVHPYTGAAPGGWGWSHRSGAVPDADDTPAALLALRHWYHSTAIDETDMHLTLRAVDRGLCWLLGLQNADGGWPTFCRGWGKLPFDRSGTDLTAHALRALRAWQDAIDNDANSEFSVSRRRVQRAVHRGFAFLKRTQRRDGAWIPLWFGNQDDPLEENPIYGTARVLLAYDAWSTHEAPAARRAASWLASQQRDDGSWGAAGGQEPSRTGSIEETALAVEALVAYRPYHVHVRRGGQWLARKILEDDVTAAPIGLYFAKLWYYEELYPWVFAVGALGRLLKTVALAREDDEQEPSSQVDRGRIKADNPCTGRAAAEAFADENEMRSSHLPLPSVRQA